MAGDFIGFEPLQIGSGTTVTGSDPVVVSNNNVSLKTQTGINPGSYTSANLTINNKGIITAISNGGGATGLFYDIVEMGTVIGWGTDIGGDYCWGGAYQALGDVTITGVKAYTIQTSGNLILSVWVNNVRVRTGTATIAGAGKYSVTFGTPLTLTVAQNFTVSAYTAGGTIPYYIVTDSSLLSIPVVAPKLRLFDTKRFATGDVEPTGSSGSYHFGCVPVVG